MSTRERSQREAAHDLPQLLGMRVQMITDNTERKTEHGRLERCTDGRWKVNKRVFGIEDIDYCQVGWIDRERGETSALIVVDEEV